MITPASQGNVFLQAHENVEKGLLVKSHNEFVLCWTRGGREALLCFFFVCFFCFFLHIFSNMLAVSVESVIPQEMYVDSVAHRILWPILTYI